MPQLDAIKKTRTQDGEAIILCASVRDLLGAAMKRLNAGPAAAIHLGQALLAGALVKGLPDTATETRLELQWKLNGPLGNMYVDAWSEGRLRGALINAEAPLTALKGSLGSGFFQVQRMGKNTVTGIVQSVGDVVVDVLEYLDKSEQKSCAMNLWVDLDVREESGQAPELYVRNAVGYLIHVLPQSQESRTLELLYNWDQHLRSLGPLSQWVLGDDTIHNCLSCISGEFSPKIYALDSLVEHCTCSEDRAARALLFAKAQSDFRESLGGSFGDSGIVETAKPAETIRCEFCGSLYTLPG